MIKIDFHIHTVPSKPKNETFVFSLKRLGEYVKERELNAIAITNHNLFDKDNYETIKNYLSIAVFPGIEVDLDTGHMLVITDEDNIDTFLEKCSRIKDITDSKSRVEITEFFDIFNDNRNDYLFIPHYKKSPKIQRQIINAFGNNIFCGEVDNQNKFIRLFKEENELTPVLFSDSRLNDESALPLRFTYIDINSTNFYSIKEGIRDKTKVYLNGDKSRDSFVILDDGTEASTGLNIIVGKRSSGKTHTINKIFENFNNPKIDKSVKYIRQFDLVEVNEEKSEEQFSKKLANEKLDYEQEYLSNFKEIVDHVQTIDLSRYDTEADDFVSKLVEYATNVDKHDTFAKVPLFSEQLFIGKSTKEIDGLIEATIKLLDSKTYRQMINETVSRKSLINLLKKFVEEYKKVSKECICYTKANEIITNVQKALSIKSNQDSIPNFDLVKYAKDKMEVDNFIGLVKAIKTEKEIKSIPVGRFRIAAFRKPIKRSSELQKIYKTKGTCSDVFCNYDNPYVYLRALKKSDTIPSDQLHKAFVQISYDVLNEEGLKVSGGERAEYNLEDKLRDANDYEMLLIDEPESSFDNIFLKEQINTKIKQLSKRMPVFVSTHNNVVGASIKADYIIYTEKLVENRRPVFRIYTGESTSKILKTVDGIEMNNFDIQLNSLEGGLDLYEDRRQTYENIKNR